MFSAYEKIEDDDAFVSVIKAAQLIGVVDEDQKNNVNFGKKSQINIYLDIDGVLLTKDLKPAKFAAEFLKYVLSNYPDSSYWLTTHCQGDAGVPIEHIKHLFDSDTVELMKNIKPTTWDMAKTRGIDFTKPFLWFDDGLFYEEEQTLIANGVLENLIAVDLKKDPDQLGKYLADFPMPINA